MPRKCGVPLALGWCGLLKSMILLGAQAKPTVKLNRQQSVIRVINSRSKGDHLPAQRDPVSVATEKCNKLQIFQRVAGKPEEV
jgi:hypothetical protein